MRQSSVYDDQWIWTQVCDCQPVRYSDCWCRVLYYLNLSYLMSSAVRHERLEFLITSRRQLKQIVKWISYDASWKTWTIIICLILFPLSTLSIVINSTFIIEWEIYLVISLTIKLDLILEWRRTIYSAAVIFVSGRVLKFSKTYIRNDRNKLRFAHALRFIVSVNLLIFIPDILCLLNGWDGLGIIVIYYTFNILLLVPHQLQNKSNLLHHNNQKHTLKNGSKWTNRTNPARPIRIHGHSF